MTKFTKLIRELLADRIEQIDVGNNHRTIGFEEKSWSMKDINDFKTKYWNK